MAYNNNVPLGSQTIAYTTDPIRNNFAFLQTGIGLEHNFDATDATKMYHTQVSMPDLGGAPVLPSGTNGLLYLVSGELRYLDGSNRVNRLTAANISAKGYQWLGRSLIQWGDESLAIGNIDVTFQIAFPVGVYSIIVTPHKNLSASNPSDFYVRDDSVTVNGFRIRNASASSFGFYWMAIGS